jgi:hypothetical protein
MTLPPYDAPAISATSRNSLEDAGLPLARGDDRAAFLIRKKARTGLGG